MNEINGRVGLIAAAFAFLGLLVSGCGSPERLKGAASSAEAGGDCSGVGLEIVRRGMKPSIKGSSKYFIGAVRIDPMIDAKAPARLLGGSVTFEPGARTAWHTHPLGQALIVTSGCGWTQRWGGPVETIRTGDVVWIPPGVKHWHGATATTAMTHIAIEEKLDGVAVEWLEQVSDAQYQACSDGETKMATEHTGGRKAYGDISPTLGELTDKVLFDQVWERAGLSKRDRSLITVAALVAGYRTNELPYHMRFAIENGVQKDELVELITHLAFYSGWPAANTAVTIARDVFAQMETE